MDDSTDNPWKSSENEQKDFLDPPSPSEVTKPKDEPSMQIHRVATKIAYSNHPRRCENVRRQVSQQPKPFNRLHPKIFNPKMVNVEHFVAKMHDTTIKKAEVVKRKYPENRMRKYPETPADPSNPVFRNVMKILRDSDEMLMQEAQLPKEEKKKVPKTPVRIAPRPMTLIGTPLGQMTPIRIASSHTTPRAIAPRAMLPANGRLKIQRNIIVRKAMNSTELVQLYKQPDGSYRRDQHPNIDYNQPFSPVPRGFKPTPVMYKPSFNQRTNNIASIAHRLRNTPSTFSPAMKEAAVKARLYPVQATRVRNESLPSIEDMLMAQPEKKLKEEVKVEEPEESYEEKVIKVEEPDGDDQRIMEMFRCEETLYQADLGQERMREEPVEESVTKMEMESPIREAAPVDKVDFEFETVKVPHNGILVDVPIEIVCHLCEAVMRIDMRKLNYRGEMREYLTYRCLRKGCQTFKSVKKAIEGPTQIKPVRKRIPLSENMRPFEQLFPDPLAKYFNREPLIEETPTDALLRIAEEIKEKIVKEEVVDDSYEQLTPTNSSNCSDKTAPSTPLAHFDKDNRAQSSDYMEQTEKK